MFKCTGQDKNGPMGSQQNAAASSSQSTDRDFVEEPSLLGESDSAFLLKIFILSVSGGLQHSAFSEQTLQAIASCSCFSKCSKCHRSQ